MGLIWVGEMFYKTPRAFLKEAAEQGISRRIRSIPRDFKLGETCVWLAHRKAVEGVDMTPGVFYAFLPQRIEYIVKGDETEEKLRALGASDTRQKVIHLSNGCYKKTTSTRIDIRSLYSTVCESLMSHCRSDHEQMLE